MAILRRFGVTALPGLCELAGRVVALAGPELLCVWHCPAGPAVAGRTAQCLGLAVCSDQACPSTMPRDPRFSDYMYGVSFFP